MHRICVLGTGGWGTSLAIHLRNRGCQVNLWGRDRKYVEELSKTRENIRYLPGIKIPPEVHLQSDAAEAFDDVELVLEVIPTQYIRPVLKRVRSHYPEKVPMISGSKGIENHTLFTGTEIIRDVLGEDLPVGVLSGPSHCEEMVRGRPTGVVVAASDAELSKKVQTIFNGSNFRVYTNSDLVGVELCGAMKNVVAIAAGICDGLGYGDNAKAALVTRGLNEMARLGFVLGAKDHTFRGLAGVGDLYTTCASPYGRNLSVGERLGQGEKLDEIRASMGQVAEGVATTRSVVELAKKHGVELPICDAIHKVLFHHKPPAKAVQELMSREPGEE